MKERKTEALRIAKELGLPVTEETTVTDLVLLLSDDPDIAPELSEALGLMLAPQGAKKNKTECAE